VREKYCWLVADKPSEQGVNLQLVAQFARAISPFLLFIIRRTLKN
jgi:hypothetical protein